MTCDNRFIYVESDTVSLIVNVSYLPVIFILMLDILYLPFMLVGRGVAVRGVAAFRKKRAREVRGGSYIRLG